MFPEAKTKLYLSYLLCFQIHFKLQHTTLQSQKSKNKHASKNDQTTYSFSRN